MVVLSCVGRMSEYGETNIVHWLYCAQPRIP